MKVYSLLDQDNQDVISQCLSAIKDGQFSRLKKEKSDQKCLDKIIATLRYFICNKMTPDGNYCKSLEGNILEFRCKIPNSDYLLRIIAWHEKQSTILLTGHLIKPEHYDDTYTKQITRKEYQQYIDNATQCWSDFMGKQNYPYIDLTDLLIDN